MYLSCILVGRRNGGTPALRTVNLTLFDVVSSILDNLDNLDNPKRKRRRGAAVSSKPKDCSKSEHLTISPDLPSQRQLSRSSTRRSPPISPLSVAVFGGGATSNQRKNDGAQSSSDLSRKRALGDLSRSPAPAIRFFFGGGATSKKKTTTVNFFDDLPKSSKEGTCPHHCPHRRHENALSTQWCGPRASPSARSTRRAARTRLTAHAATRTRTSTSSASCRVVGVATPATSAAFHWLCHWQLFLLAALNSLLRLCLCSQPLEATAMATNVTSEVASSTAGAEPSRGGSLTVRRPRHRLPPRPLRDVSAGIELV